jgi:TolA-binding protein
VVVNGDLELTGGAVFETTLASSDVVEVNNGGVTLTDSPTVEIVTDAQFNETASFTVIANDGTDGVSGSVSDSSLLANSQEYLVEVNAGDGNDLVINRQNTERVDPTSGSTGRGGRDEVKSTTMISVPGEDGLDETVTDPVPENEQASMAGVVARQGMDEEEEEPTGDEQEEELPEEEVTESEAASSTSGYLGNSAQRNRDRVDGLQQQLNQLEQEGQSDSDRAQQLREQIDFLTELADRQQQTQQQMTDGQDVSAGGDGDDADLPHMVGVHDVSPDESLQEITADQLRRQLLNDLQLGVFADAVDGPILGAVLSGLDSSPIEEPPGVAELRDVTQMAGQWAQSRGDTGIAEQMNNVRSDAPWWVNERTLRFRTGVHGQQAPWGMSVVDVRMSRETGQYVLHASVWIDEGASNVAVGDLFEQYAGGDVSAYEGSWHTLTLTGQVTPR